MVDLSRQFIWLTLRAIEDQHLDRVPLPSDGEVFQMFIISSRPIFNYIESIGGTLDQLESLSESARFRVIKLSMHKYLQQQHHITFTAIINEDEQAQQVVCVNKSITSNTTDTEPPCELDSLPSTLQRSAHHDGEIVSTHDPINVKHSLEGSLNVMKVQRNRDRRLRRKEKKLRERTALLMDGEPESEELCIRTITNAKQEKHMDGDLDTVVKCVESGDPSSESVNIVVSSTRELLILQLHLSRLLVRNRYSMRQILKIVPYRVQKNEWLNRRYDNTYIDFVDSNARGYYIPSHFVYDGNYYILEVQSICQWLKISYVPCPSVLNLYVRFPHSSELDWNKSIVPKLLLTQSYRSTVHKGCMNWCRWIRALIGNKELEKSCVVQADD